MSSNVIWLLLALNQKHNHFSRYSFSYLTIWKLSLDHGANLSHLAVSDSSISSVSEWMFFHPCRANCADMIQHYLKSIWTC